MKLQTILMLGVTTVIFVSASSVLRAYAGGAALWVLLLALALYVSGNVLVVPLMREGGLGITISILSVTQLLTINLLAWLIYSERLTPIQMAGMGLGVVAMVLMLWPKEAAL
nr:hypothetical protein [uncultured Gellertiella sp.]